MHCLERKQTSSSLACNNLPLLYFTSSCIWEGLRLYDLCCLLTWSRNWINTIGVVWVQLHHWLVVLLASAITEQNGNPCYNAKNDGLVQAIYVTKTLDCFTKTHFALRQVPSHEPKEVVHTQYWKDNSKFSIYLFGTVDSFD